MAHHDDGRDEEFVAFTTAHRRALMRMAALLAAGDPALAEDLVQTALTKLYVAWPRVRRAEDHLAYARRTLSHCFIDETRRAHRRRETALAVVPDRGAAPGPDVETRDAVLAALRALPPGQRAVVVLRHWLDLDVAATARTLGCTTGTVKSQNAKALAHLRAALEPAHPFSARTTGDRS